MRQKRVSLLQKLGSAATEIQKIKTINSRYSLVVTDPTTNLSLIGLSTGDRTGTPVFRKVWSIATKHCFIVIYKPFVVWNCAQDDCAVLLYPDRLQYTRHEGLHSCNSIAASVVPRFQKSFFHRAC